MANPQLGGAQDIKKDEVKDLRGDDEEETGAGADYVGRFSFF